VGAFGGGLQTRPTEPLIDLRGLANRRLLPLFGISFVFGVAGFGAQTAMVTFMGTPRAVGYGLSLSVSQISLVLIPCSLAGFAAAVLASRLTMRFGDRTAFLSGGALLVAGFAVPVVWHDTTWELGAGMALQYAGIGVVQATLPAVLSAAATATGRGVTTGLGDALKGLGGGLSTAAFATVEGALVIAHTHVPRESAYVSVWGLCGLVSLCVVPLAAVLADRARPAMTGPAPAVASD
jgi:MFS family permease